MLSFYVTVIRDAKPKKRVGWLSGPFSTLEEAEAGVPLARRIACELDPWCDFDYFGVTAIDSDIPTQGVLQDHIDHYETYGVVNW